MELATLTTIDGMDSRDIAAATGKRHDNVLRDIRAMLAELEIDELRFEGSYLTEQNKTAKCYILPKRECLILASGYNLSLRAAVIDRWAELESSDPKFIIPKTFSEALRLCADQQEKIEAQVLQIKEQAPAVEFVDKFVESKQTQPLRAVAKVLQIPEKKFVAALLEKGILYRLNGRLTPKQEHLNLQRFEMKELMMPNGFTAPQMSFTPTGVTWIASRVKELMA